MMGEAKTVLGSSVPPNVPSVDFQTDSPSPKALDSLSQLEEMVAKELQDSATATLTIVVPAYNERKTIDRVLEALVALPIEKQIVVVDDGSTDGTRERLQAWSSHKEIEIFLHASNQGKGAALQTGFRMAAGNIIIVQDADLEYSPSDILRVVQPILDGQADVVYGSRYLNSQLEGSRIHRLGNQFLTWFSNLWTGQKLTDMETCYKAFRRDVLRKISIQQNRFGFEPEITAKIAKQGVQIAEVPIQYRARSWSEGKKIGVKDLFNTLYCIVRYGLF